MPARQGTAGAGRKDGHRMDLDALRGRLGQALQDPGRRQLAHIAVLDIAMAVTEALQQKGVTPADVARAAEEISEFLTDESGELPSDLANRQAVLDTLTETLRAAAQNPAFARVFAESPPTA